MLPECLIRLNQSLSRDNFKIDAIEYFSQFLFHSQSDFGQTAVCEFLMEKETESLFTTEQQSKLRITYFSQYNVRNLLSNIDIVKALHIFLEPIHFGIILPHKVNAQKLEILIALFAELYSSVNVDINKWMTISNIEGIVSGVVMLNTELHNTKAMGEVDKEDFVWMVSRGMTIDKTTVDIEGELENIYEQIEQTPISCLL